MTRAFQTHRPHPWHGLEVGPDSPFLVNAFVEITPFDTVKWEIDKATGYLCVDRPQRTNSLPPTVYGFIPRTYCGEEVARLAGTEVGDGDPLDICILSERPITRADVLLHARPVGGLLMVDHGEADDKIIGVLDNDPVWGDARDIDELPTNLIERLRHYFLTYKHVPGDTDNPVAVDSPYGAERAREVIGAAVADYQTFLDGE